MHKRGCLFERWQYSSTDKLSPNVFQSKAMTEAFRCPVTLFYLSLNKQEESNDNENKPSKSK
jgi:hypothetical protein